MRNVICVGMTRKTVPSALGEPIAPARDRMPQVLERLGRVAPERVLLCTCERIEVYLAAETVTDETCLGCLADLTGLPQSVVRTHASVRAGSRAAGHLLRVAAGLESSIVGEDHVLGQVREAHRAAADLRTTGPVLSALFRAAIHTGKRVRHETQINHCARSYAKSAASCVVDAMRSTERPAVVVLGTGHLARSVARHLAGHQAVQVIIASRSVERADALARLVGGLGIGYEGLTRAIERADAVVTCTSSPPFALGPWMIRRERRPLTVVDLGVPRNVDPAVGTVPGVSLRHLDQLETDEGPAQRTLDAAGHIVREELRRFTQWLEGRRAAPLIAELIRRAERHDPATARTIKRRLHAPIMRLKEGTAA